MGSLIKVAVPDGIGPAMEKLTKAILEEQPADIYKFAYKHFQMRLQRRQEAGMTELVDEGNATSEPNAEDNAITPSQPNFE